MKTKVLLLAFALLSCMSGQAQTKQFEGEFHLKNTVTVDKTLQKISKLARSGEYTMDFVRRGQDEFCEESYAGTTCLMLRSQDMCYVWSKLLKKGYKFSWSGYQKQCDETHANAEKSVKSTGETKDFFGYTCKHYKGEENSVTDLLGAKMTTRTELDYWVCEDYPAEYMNSTKVEGMPFYYEDNSRIRVPLLGEGAQHQTINVTSITERKVEDSELAVPTDISFETVKDGYRAQQKLGKEILKYKKKNNIADEGLKTEGVSQEKGEWDF